jgi:DHA2 family methylenomycin A resistance protein-like MFS transporter
VRNGPHFAAATLAVACLGTFMVTLDVTVVNVALPAMAADLGADLPGLQWIVDSYTLAFAAVLLTGGALGDTVGARRVFVAGLGVFTAASAGCGLAPSTTALIAFRVGQGLGAALIVPCALALVHNAFPDPARRARAVAVWVAAGGAALAAGPVLGGLGVHLLNWRAIFLANVVLGVAGILVAGARVRSTPRRPRRLDPAGQATAVVAIGGLTFVLIEGPHLGWTHPAVTVVLVAAVLGAVAFVATERRAVEPMLPPALAANPAFAGAAAVGGLLNLAFYGQIFVFSLFFQQVLGKSALETGLCFLPMTVLVAASNLAAPTLSRRFGAPAVIIGGELILAAGLLLALTAGPDVPAWLVALTLLPVGLAAVSIPPLTSRLLESVPAALAGVGSGAFAASRQVGGAIGVAVFGALLGSGNGFLAGMRYSLVAASGAAVLAAVLTTWLVRAPATAPLEPKR